MITIRTEQMQAFEAVAWLRFEDEMVKHSRTFTPPLCAVLGEEQLRVALRRAIARAGTYGFTYRGPIRLFIELGFLLGSDFDTDPQYRWTAEILESQEEQMVRAEKLVARMTEFQHLTCGPEGVYTSRAFEALLATTRKPTAPAGEESEGFLRQELRRVYPEKVAYIGDHAVGALIRKANASAKVHEFPLPEGRTLMTVLMFAFGHGCEADPLYPWIGRTLSDDKIADPAARAERLKKKAVTWLEHVLKNTLGEAPLS